MARNEMLGIQAVSKGVCRNKTKNELGLRLGLGEPVRGPVRVDVGSVSEPAGWVEYIRVVNPFGLICS